MSVRSEGREGTVNIFISASC